MMLAVPPRTVRRHLRVAAVALALAALSGAAPVLAQGNLRQLRFRRLDAVQVQSSPATFNAPLPVLQVEFEGMASPEGGEAVDLSLRAPGGLLLAQQRVGLAGADWKAYSVLISGRQLCANAMDSWGKGWRNLIASANRLAGARAGHQEFLMQVHADALVLLGHADVVGRMTLAPGAQAGRADVSARAAAAQAKVLRARDLDPQDVAGIQDMAKEIAADGQAALAPMDALAAAAPCPEGMSWPVFETQDYDLTLSSGGFPSISGEIRVVASPRVFLPRLSAR